MLRLLRSPGSPPHPELAPGEQVDPLRTLARQAAAGSEGAKRTLIIALGPGLLRAVRGVLGVHHPDVEDVLQESMAAVCTALPTFRGECRTLHFACRIGVQTAMNARRRSGTRSRHVSNVPHDELADIAHDDRSPAEALLATRRKEALRDLLSELPPPKSEVLALHIVLGYSVEETAAVTGCPVNTVRSRLRSALSDLRSRLQEDGALLELMQGGR
jgi:RNA polymerase sigma-70 factor (ECF subfamily)